MGLLQLSQPPGLLDLHAAVTLSPAVTGRLRHLDDTANVGDSDGALGPLRKHPFSATLVESARHHTTSLVSAFPKPVSLTAGPHPPAATKLVQARHQPAKPRSQRSQCSQRSGRLARLGA